jgi:hypothetical protein
MKLTQSKLYAIIGLILISFFYTNNLFWEIIKITALITTSYGAYHFRNKKEQLQTKFSTLFLSSIVLLSIYRIFLGSHGIVIIIAFIVACIIGIIISTNTCISNVSCCLNKNKKVKKNLSKITSKKGSKQTGNKKNTKTKKEIAKKDKEKTKPTTKKQTVKKQVKKNPSKKNNATVSKKTSKKSSETKKKKTPTKTKPSNTKKNNYKEKITSKEVSYKKK